MANFTVTNTTAMGGGNVQASLTANNYFTLIATWASTVGNGTFATGPLRRGKLYDILVGTNGTPADNALEYDVRRITIGSSVAPQLAGGISSLSSNFGLDTADNGGANSQIFINSSVTAMANTTFNTEVWYVGVNQRASYRWVAAPGSELVWPANTSGTGNNGLSGNARSATYTGTVTMNWLFQEQ